MSEPVQVLLVEDSEDDALLLERQLRGLAAAVRVERVDTGEALEQALGRQAWDIVIGDYSIPGFGGLEALDIVRARFPDLPFLLVSATVGEDVAVQAMRAGANDYLMKGRLARLLPAVQRELREAATRRDHRQRLHRLAYYDAITGLANRTLFCERLGQLTSAAKRDQQRLAVVVVDLDRFRAINESLGRQAGDALLVQAGARLAACAADPAHVARTGGDQFALIHPGLKSESELARATLDSLRLCFGEPFRLEGGDYRVAARAGIALFPDDGADAEVLLRNAEAAVLKAKAGKDAYLFYTERLTARVAHNLTLENRLRHALERQEFVLHYQPKVEIASRRIVGAEALIRWNSEEGLVPPSEFIPMLEETGMIVEVGAWVLRQAVHDRMRWRSEGVRAPRVAVNVSVIQLRRADFLRVVRDALAPGGPAHGIDFEITESLLALDAEGALAKLTEVRTLGVDLAIDDFGTGYSSLAYLARLPVQQLKIDRAFIVAMLTDPRAMTLVSTIALMARSMGFTAIAEGVETEEQARALLEAGCVQMQGYLTGRPMPAEQLTPRLERESVLRAPEAHPFR